MSFNVRFFGYQGMDQIKQVNPRQYTGDAVFVMREPYVWRELVASSASAQTVPPHTEHITILRIEVADGEAIRYEINPPNRSVPADSGSPRLEGFNNFFFGPGWNISFIDAAGLP